MTSSFNANSNIVSPTRKESKSEVKRNVDTEMCEWLFCPSDIIFSADNFNSDGMIRIYPPSNKYSIFQQRNEHSLNKNTTYESNADLIHIEPNTDIYYFHFGDMNPGNINCYINTMDYQWPKNYTFILWVKWELNCTSITTFDSAWNAPIGGSSIDPCLLRCASLNTNGWVYAKKAEILFNEWQFVVAVGGRDEDEKAKNSDNQPLFQTQFFCGTLAEEPTFREMVPSDICGLTTNSIGRFYKGPGMVAYIKVLKCHLSIEQIVDEYHLSLNEMYGSFWTDEEYAAVVLLLNKYCFEVEDILQLIIHYCCRQTIIDKYTEKYISVE